MITALFILWYMIAGSIAAFSGNIAGSIFCGLALCALIIGDAIEVAAKKGKTDA